MHRDTISRSDLRHGRVELGTGAYSTKKTKNHSPAPKDFLPWDMIMKCNGNGCNGSMAIRKSMAELKSDRERAESTDRSEGILSGVVD